MKKYLISAYIIGIMFGGLQAQVVDTAYFQLNYVPHLLNFEKISTPATITDTAQEKVAFDYYITPQKVDVTFSPTPIKATKIAPEPMKRLYRNFIKVGFGYPLTPLAELSIHNGSNKKYSFGLNVHHFSSWAQPIGKTMKQYTYYPTSDTKSEFFFSRFFKKQTLYSSVGYNHQSARYYGFKIADTPLPTYYSGDLYEDSLKTHFHHVRAEIGLRSNYNLDERALKQDVRINYDGIFTRHHDMENHIGLTSFFAYDARWLKISGSQLYRLNLNFDYYNNKYGPIGDSLLPSSHAVRFNPEIYAHWTFNEYHILVGLGTAIGSKTNQNKVDFAIYPLGEVQLGLIRGILSIYAGVNGNLVYNSYEKLLYENPFIKPQLTDTRYTKNWIHIYGGIKGNLVKKLNYNVFAEYTYAQNMLFYVQDTSAILHNQFDVVYDDGGYLHVGLNMNWEVMNQLHLSLDGDYWLYHLNTIQKPWYKPALEFGFSGKYFFKDFLVFNANFDLGFGRWAWALDPETSTTYEAQLMKPILDFGIGAEWLINKQFTAFLNVHNIAGQYYAKYYDYRSFGINVLAGVTYSFGEQSLKKGKKR